MKRFLMMSEVKILTLLLVGLTAASTRAATRTWSGAGGDANWATAANWGGTVPSTGDNVVFPTGSWSVNLGADAAINGFQVSAEGQLTLSGGHKLEAIGNGGNSSGAFDLLNPESKSGLALTVKGAGTDVRLESTTTTYGYRIRNITNGRIKACEGATFTFENWYLGSKKESYAGIDGLQFIATGKNTKMQLGYNNGYTSYLMGKGLEFIAEDQAVLALDNAEKNKGQNIIFAPDFSENALLKADNATIEVNRNSLYMGNGSSKGQQVILCGANPQLKIAKSGYFGEKAAMTLTFKPQPTWSKETARLTAVNAININSNATIVIDGSDYTSFGAGKFPLMSSGSYGISFSSQAQITIQNFSPFLGVTTELEKEILYLVITSDSTLNVPTVKAKPYTGKKQTADLETSDLYTITNEGGTNVGSYPVVFALVDKSKYRWEDGSTTNQTRMFEITRADNSWKVAPSVDPLRVGEGEAYTVKVGTPAFGTSQVTYSTGSVKPTQAGEYTAIFTVEGTNNYGPLSSNIIFKIVGANGWKKEPAMSKTVYNFGEPIQLNLGEALHGTPVATYRDAKGKVSSEVPTAIGTYTAVITVSGGADWTDLSKEFSFEIKAAENDWVIAPSVWPIGWVSGALEPTIDEGQALFGEVTYAVYSNGVKKSTMPTAPGCYEIVFSVKAGEGYTALETTIPVRILSGYTEGDEDPALEYTYTWNNAAGGLWKRPDNWIPSESPCRGYPDGTNVTAYFNQPTEAVTLNGEFALDTLKIDAKGAASLVGDGKLTGRYLTVSGLLQVYGDALDFTGTNPYVGANGAFYLEGATKWPFGKRPLNWAQATTSNGSQITFVNCTFNESAGLNRNNYNSIKCVNLTNTTWKVEGASDYLWLGKVYLVAKDSYVVARSVKGNNYPNSAGYSDNCYGDLTFENSYFEVKGDFSPMGGDVAFHFLGTNSTLKVGDEFSLMLKDKKVTFDFVCPKEGYPQGAPIQVGSTNRCVSSQVSITCSSEVPGSGFRVPLVTAKVHEVDLAQLNANLQLPAGLTGRLYFSDSPTGTPESTKGKTLWCEARPKGLRVYVR